ncbi:hypothetical protein H5410_000338 [Solanum commersonii]|uniref:Uncharacterized protein n=1 Tax=Solanum commersonii TaxID=4109 RepID=A0A9J6AVL5_SOLCO|nr:hypothetical protein H5410_000338 [Solanum commersonii]
MSLQGRFEENEVLYCLKLCAADKAPGPRWVHNGFLHQVLGCLEERHHGHISKFYEQEVLRRVSALPSLHSFQRKRRSQ